MLAFLCDHNGQTMCGTDGVVHVDGRKTTTNQIQEAREYRERFKKHFPHKYDSWTHVFFAKSVKLAPNHGEKPQRMYQL